MERRGKRETGHTTAVGRGTSQDGRRSGGLDEGTRDAGSEDPGRIDPLDMAVEGREGVAGEEGGPSGSQAEQLVPRATIGSLEQLDEERDDHAREEEAKGRQATDGGSGFQDGVHEVEQRDVALLIRWRWCSRVPHDL